MLAIKYVSCDRGYLRNVTNTEKLACPERTNLSESLPEVKLNYLLKIRKKKKPIKIVLQKYPSIFDFALLCFF